MRRLPTASCKLNLNGFSHTRLCASAKHQKLANKDEQILFQQIQGLNFGEVWFGDQALQLRAFVGAVQPTLSDDKRFSYHVV